MKPVTSPIMSWDSKCIQNIEDVVDASLLRRDGIEHTKGVVLLGNSRLNIIAFTTTEDPHLIRTLYSCIRGEGWGRRSLDNPPAIQIHLTNAMVARVHEMLPLIRQKLLLIREWNETTVREQFPALAKRFGDDDDLICFSKTTMTRAVLDQYAIPIFMRYRESEFLALFGNACGR